VNKNKFAEKRGSLGAYLKVNEGINWRDGRYK